MVLSLPNLLVILNADNNYEGTFENLQVYDDETNEKINYEIKYFEDGEYKSLNDDELTESERKRLEEVRMRRKEAEEMAKYKKEKEKEKE